MCVCVCVYVCVLIHKNYTYMYRTYTYVCLKDKYPTFKVRLKGILMVFPYLLLCFYTNESDR